MNFDDTERNGATVDPQREATATRRSSQSTWRPTYRRRQVLRTIGGVTIAGLLAGCVGDGSDGNADPNDGGGPRSVDEWLADTGNYDGVVDRTDEDAVTVVVGASGNSGSNAFAPAAIEVSPGTTVTWEWVNGYHNVIADGEFDSGEPEQNATFEHTFETAETVYYYCEPHRSMGMKGAVVVSESDSGGSQ